MKFTEAQIARVCHEANRALCMAALDDHTKPSWESASEHIHASAISGVKKALAEPDASPESMWAAWKEYKLADGWKLGPLYAPDLKEHPNLVDSYDMLPEGERAKDALFIAIVRTLSGAHEPLWFIPGDGSPPQRLPIDGADAVMVLGDKPAKKGKKA